MSNIFLTTRSNVGTVILAALVLLSLVTTSCSPEETPVESSKKKKDVTPAPADATGVAPGAGPIDYEKVCGIKIDGADENAIFFQQSLRSLPIVVEGSQLNLSFRVTTQVSIDIMAKKSGATSQVKAEVLNVEVAASSPMIQMLGMAIAKGKAKSAVADITGPVQTTGLPLIKWINLTTSDPAYNNLLCAVTAVQKMEDTQGEKKEEGVVEFSPGLPININPLAPRETLEKEIGSERTFSVIAKISKSKKNWLPVGDHGGVVTIKPRAPSFTLTDGRTISSDLAYEVIATFPIDPKNKDKAKPPYQSHRLYFINTKMKNLDAVIELSNTGIIEGSKFPPVVLLRP